MRFGGFSCLARRFCVFGSSRAEVLQCEYYFVTPGTNVRLRLKGTAVLLLYTAVVCRVSQV